MGHQNWPVGQAVKTPPFHGGIRGSIPLPVTIIRSLSSAGRASALQAECRRFDPVSDHHFFHVTSYVWPGGSVGQNAALSRRRSRVRVPSGSPNLPRQLSWQSKGLKIPVSTVRFCAEAPLENKTLATCGCFFISRIMILKGDCYV